MANFWRGFSEGVDIGGKMIAQQGEVTRNKLAKEQLAAAERTNKQENDYQSALEQLGVEYPEFASMSGVDPAKIDAKTGTATQPAAKREKTIQGQMDYLTRLADIQLRHGKMEIPTYMQMVQASQAMEEKGVNQIAMAALHGASPEQIMMLVQQNGGDDMDQLVDIKSEPIEIAGTKYPNMVMTFVDKETGRRVTINPAQHLQSMRTMDQLIEQANGDRAFGLEMQKFQAAQEYQRGMLGIQQQRLGIARQNAATAAANARAKATDLYPGARFDKSGNGWYIDPTDGLQKPIPRQGSRSAEDEALFWGDSDRTAVSRLGGRFGFEDDPRNPNYGYHVIGPDGTIYRSGQEAYAGLRAGALKNGGANLTTGERARAELGRVPERFTSALGKGADMVYGSKPVQSAIDFTSRNIVEPFMETYGEPIEEPGIDWMGSPYTPPPGMFDE